jgi:hypothetical protein
MREGPGFLRGHSPSAPSSLEKVVDVGGRIFTFDIGHPVYTISE